MHNGNAITDIGPNKQYLGFQYVHRSRPHVLFRGALSFSPVLTNQLAALLTKF